MEAALKADFISVNEYLEGEEHTQIRHEYVDGLVYAMAGATREHNRLALNLTTSLDSHLGGGPCQISIAELKLRLHFESDTFYYPDIMVTCDARDTNRRFNEHPKVIVEILSDTTERIDRIEKFNNYIRIDSLEEYVLVAQDKVKILVFRRSSGWKPEILTQIEDELTLLSLNFRMGVAQIYRGVPV
jgi:Uma2 family endonuclease